MKMFQEALHQVAITYLFFFLDENQNNIVNSFFQEHLDQQSFQELQLFITQRPDLSRSAEKCISCNGVKFTAGERSFSAECNALHSAAYALADSLTTSCTLYLHAHDYIS